MRREDSIETVLDDVAYLGEAIGRCDGKVVFAAGGMPGERVKVRVTKDGRGYLLGKVTEVLAPSRHRVKPPCPGFGICGGCQWQHISYGHQLELKRHIVAEQFRRIAKMPDAPVSEPAMCPDPWHYRNHARFTIGPDGSVGFVRYQTHSLVRVDSCLICHPKINEFLGLIQGRARGGTGVCVRVGAATGQLLVTPRFEQPELEMETGQETYEDEILGRRFRISANAFFQTNASMNDALVGLVRDMIAPTRPRLVVDAYAGVGTFAVCLAGSTDRVIAIEEAYTAVQDALENIRPFRNIEYRRGKTEDVLPDVLSGADVVILDPPRVGCDRKVISLLCEKGPEQLVYVSCNPATLARDARSLCAGGYLLCEVKPVDLFPQTYHVECIAEFKRKREPHAVATAAAGLVLASTSPRRRELVKLFNAEFDVATPAGDEEPPVAGEPIEKWVQRVALCKARGITPGTGVVVAADTVVLVDGQVLGKPASDEEARDMLRRLRGRSHTVVSGVAVVNGANARVATEHTKTFVEMRNYSDAEIDTVISRGLARDKAGAYAVQDEEFHPVSSCAGCYFNVVGLPLCALARALRAVHFKIRPVLRAELPEPCTHCFERGTLA